ncbi:NUDIX hydrolase [Ornithinimicrobium sufpigmenti]|uniref:NUDIX hydrolase n=1 Tax=Ornithinimicrobium sufpigmenti TaxID=2508882 RepID=UPI001EDDEE05|nr:MULTISPECIES: NUDIX hydrolase [unclassified Ornithinimicrobium]
MSPRGEVRAAGVVPVRLRAGTLRVAVVHRPKYDDWSWPKGKLDHGEDFVSAAVRETREETGLRVRLVAPLPQVRYTLRGGDTKAVSYWTGQVAGGKGQLQHEVDRVEWLTPDQAGSRLTYEHDRQLLGHVVERHAAGLLDAWTLLVVRHAHALSRDDWSGPDEKRPLSRSGVRRAQGRMAAVLAAYAPQLVLSSPAVRCTDSVLPYCRATGVEVVTRKGLSEEGFAADRSKVDKHLDKVLARGEAAALCTHGPVLPTLLTRLADRSHDKLANRERRMLRRLRDAAMDKGEILACTMVGTGEDARVVAVERHRPR